MQANDLVERVYQDATKELNSEALETDQETEEKIENPKIEFESGDHRLTSKHPINPSNNDSNSSPQTPDQNEEKKYYSNTFSFSNE